MRCGSSAVYRLPVEPPPPPALWHPWDAHDARGEEGGKSAFGWMGEAEDVGALGEGERGGERRRVPPATPGSCEE